MNVKLVLTSPVSLVIVLRTHCQEAVVVNIRPCMRFSHSKSRLLVLFRTLPQAAAFVTLQWTVLCGTGVMSSNIAGKKRSVLFRTLPQVAAFVTLQWTVLCGTGVMSSNIAGKKRSVRIYVHMSTDHLLRILNIQ